MIPVKTIILIIITLSVLFTLSCNPVYEETKNPLWNSLHNSKPFQSEFFHSADFRRPIGACDQAQCHGAALTGGNSGAPSCFLCHDDQWSVFTSTHTTVISGVFHRYNVDETPALPRDTNANWFISCQGCHGSTLDGTQGGPSANFPYRYSCKVCHTRFLPNKVPPPGHTADKSEEGKSGWHHYNYNSADPGGGSGNLTYCSGKACHGADGFSAAGANGTSAIAGIAAHGPACSKCHD